MKHLHDKNISYLGHMVRAWGIAIVLLVHGLIPCVWETKATDLLCKKT